MNPLQTTDRSFSDTYVTHRECAEKHGRGRWIMPTFVMVLYLIAAAGMRWIVENAQNSARLETRVNVNVKTLDSIQLEMRELRAEIRQIPKEVWRYMPRTMNSEKPQ